MRRPTAPSQQPETRTGLWPTLRELRFSCCSEMISAQRRSYTRGRSLYTICRAWPRRCARSRARASAPCRFRVVLHWPFHDSGVRLIDIGTTPASRIDDSRATCLSFYSACRSNLCLEHDLFRKPVSSPDHVRARLFRDHAPAQPIEGSTQCSDCWLPCLSAWGFSVLRMAGSCAPPARCSSAKRKKT